MGDGKMNRDKKSLISFILFFLVLSGCAAYGINLTDPSNYQVVKASIQSINDPHEGTIEIRGPRIGISMFKNDNGWATYFLRSFASSTKGYSEDSVVQIYVAVNRYGWAFFNTAYSAGKRYQTTQINRSVINCSAGCLVLESVGVDLTVNQLKREILKKPSFVFKLSGNRGDFVVEVPSAYLQAFVDKLENK